MQPTELENDDKKSEETLIIQWETVSDLLHDLKVHKSEARQDSSKILKELVEVLTKPLPIIYHQSLLTGEDPVDWRLENVAQIYRKGRKGG